MVCDRVIVSMTSYPKRIANVAMSIFLLLTRQTRKPDEIHLWLSIEEFPNMEESLPEDLRAVLNHERVFMHWLLKNTFVHKRHEIFKIASDNDCVFLIDDDVRYDDNLIASVMLVHNEHRDCIVCYNNYNPHEYDGRHILYRNNKLGAGPHINKVRWCGQSMIPAKVYPKNILDDSHKDIRSKTSPVSDECWFQPWVVYNDIPIYYLSFGWGTDIDPDNGKNKGLVAWSHQKDENGYEKRDNWLWSVLSAYPDILNKYKREFNYE